MSLRTLVTGAGGFLGRYIVELLLKRGDQVRGLARGDYPELSALGVECVRGDIRNPDDVDKACADVDVVFHTAAVASIWGPWKWFHEINTLGSRNILAACRNQGVGRLVYTSSPSVTFDGQDQCGIDESAPYPERWLAFYPQTKAVAEAEILAAGSGDLATCALRPHLIWGPRDSHLIPRLVERAKRGRLIRVGGGDNLVDMIYVENAATAHLQAADALSNDSPVNGRAYFLSQGEPVNCWEWIDEILALVDIPPVRRAISARTAYGIGAAMEAAYWLTRRTSEPRMTRFLARQLATSHYFSMARAEQDFGYRPSVTTAEGMDRLGAWMQQQGLGR